MMTSLNGQQTCYINGEYMLQRMTFISFQAHEIHYFSHSGQVFCKQNVLPTNSQKCHIQQFQTEQTHIYDTEGNHVNTVNLSAYSGLFVFARV